MEFARLLNESGLTQAQVARRLSLDPSTVTQYVQGKTRPSRTVLILFKLLMGDRSPLPGSNEDIGTELAMIRPAEARLPRPGMTSGIQRGEAQELCDRLAAIAKANPAGAEAIKVLIRQMSSALDAQADKGKGPFP